MGLREDILKKIEKKQAELLERERSFEIERASVLAYVQALQDTLKSLPRETTEGSADRIFRRGSAMALTRGMILSQKRPLHITEILSGLGKPDDHKARASITGAIGAYVRRGEVFTRPRPNTFGLVELGHNATSDEEEPPADFGSLEPRMSA